VKLSFKKFLKEIKFVWIRFIITISTLKNLISKIKFIGMNKYNKNKIYVW